MAGTLALPLRVLLESHLELRASARRGAEPSVTVRDPRLARLFGLTVADGAPDGSRRGQPDGGVRIEEARLPCALRDYFGADLSCLRWQLSPDGGLVFPSGTADGCSLTLLWLGCGERRLRHPRPEPELMLLLEGGFRDETGLWQAGDVALRARHGHTTEIEAGEAGCLVLLAGDSTRGGTGPLARLFDAVFDQIRVVGGVLRCLCCRPA